MSTVSDAQLAANRANAQLSTGPTSEEGRAKVSLNAVKTGLTGRTVLLPTDDVAAYQATIARYTTRWQPETDDERALVQSLADNDWRLQRIPTLESGVWALGYRDVSPEFDAESDPDLRRILIEARIFVVYQRQLNNLQLQGSRLRRRVEKDEQRLHKLQGDRRYEAAKRAQLESESDPDELAGETADGFEFSQALAELEAHPPSAAPATAVAPKTSKLGIFQFSADLNGYDFSNLNEAEIELLEAQLEEEERTRDTRIAAHIATMRAEVKAEVAAKFARERQKKVA